MNWRTDFENAPKGETRSFTVTHYKSGKPIAKTITVKQPLLISVAGEVIKSAWSEKRNQWMGLADGQQPDAWMPWPDPVGVRNEPATD